MHKVIGLRAVLREASWRSPTLALLAIAFVHPVMISALFFPTPAGDLREQINWGLNFPLYTYKHPPLQSWIAGLAALVGVRDSWFYILCAQILTALAFVYLVRIARDFTGRDAIGPVLIVGAASFYLSRWPLVIALNADQIQPLLWAGAVYHAMKAARDDRWRDWLFLGVLLGLAMLAKYSAVLLILALGAAALWIADYRRVFGNKKLYCAAALGSAMVLPNLALELRAGQAAAYGAQYFNAWASAFRRAQSLVTLVGGPVLLLAPLWIAAPLLWKRGWLSIGPDPRCKEVRLLLAAAAVLALLFLGLIILGGLRYVERFSYAWLPLAALVAFCLVHVDERGLLHLTHVALAIWVLAELGAVGYAMVAINASREPAPAAADLVRQDWDRRYSCGPGYILGEKFAAHGVALYFDGPGRRITGASIDDYRFAQWIAKDRIRRLGAVVIARDEAAAGELFATDFPQRTAPVRLDLPYRRIWSNARHRYFYSFIPPRDC
jgi:4-amino-4-deoxy-L-arabinose transferase-like glycosyltransferase